MNINFTLIAQALAFAALIWIIATKIWPPLMKAIEERQQKIAEGLAAADRSQKDLAQAQEKVNEALKEARGKANEIIDQAHARANQIVEAAKNEAIAEANRLPYGLAAYAFTRSLKNAHLLSQRIEAGMLWVNQPALPLPEMPFGGVKDSGYGSEGGPEALEAYLNSRAVSIANV